MLSARMFSKKRAGVVATGGNISTSGEYKIHTFLTSGTFVVALGGLVDVLVVAGGAGSGSQVGGGGGAGGVIIETDFSVSVGSITVTVGAGGIQTTYGDNGDDSVFSTLTAKGGGKGGSSQAKGQDGGSGGGGAWYGAGASYMIAGNGTTDQGWGGANTPNYDTPNPCGGGGGADHAGYAPTDVTHAGNGGNGRSCSFSGETLYYGGGGAGGFANDALDIGVHGTGGLGGGGGTQEAGDANTGGGAGGFGGAGGSGIVIIRYKM